MEAVYEETTYEMDYDPELAKYHLLGEQVYEKYPQARRVDDTLVSHAVPSFYEDGRRIPIKDESCQAKVVSYFKKDLRLLKKLGVHIPDYSIKIREIPKFNKSGQADETTSGLLIVSDYVDGHGMDEIVPYDDDVIEEIAEKTDLLVNGLMRYLNIKEHEWLKKPQALGCFLGSIVERPDYVIGTATKDKSGEEYPYLIGLDPFYVKATPSNFAKARESINRFTEDARELRGGDITNIGILDDTEDDFNPEVNVDSVVETEINSPPRGYVSDDIDKEEDSMSGRLSSTTEDLDSRDDEVVVF